MDELFVHCSDGSFKSVFDIPGTLVKRKENLPYSVRSEFPLGVVKEIAEPCGQVYRSQDPDREYCHVLVEKTFRGNKRNECFHPYRDTLEVVKYGQINP